VTTPKSATKAAAKPKAPAKPKPAATPKVAANSCPQSLDRTHAQPDSDDCQARRYRGGCCRSARRHRCHLLAARQQQERPERQRIVARIAVRLLKAGKRVRS
jgi:hypothetical protein